MAYEILTFITYNTYEIKSKSVAKIVLPDYAISYRTNKLISFISKYVQNL